LAKTNTYWTEIQENAIIRYNSTNSQLERSIIYRKHLQAPLQTMCESILFRYFQNNVVYMNRYQIGELLQDTAIKIVAILPKYDTAKKQASGSYGYFSTAVKFHYISYFKEVHKENGINSSIDSLSERDELQLSYEENFFNEELDEAVRELKRKISHYKESDITDVLLAMIYLLTEEKDENRYDPLYIAIWLPRVTGYSIHQLVKILNRCDMKIIGFSSEKVGRKALKYYEENYQVVKEANSSQIVQNWESEAISVWREKKKDFNSAYAQIKYRVEDNRKNLRSFR
jgi:hypothetical protein